MSHCDQCPTVAFAGLPSPPPLALAGGTGHRWATTWGGDQGCQGWTAVRRAPSPQQPPSPSDGCLPVTRRLAMGDFSQLWMQGCELFLARLQINRQLHSQPARMHAPGPPPCRAPFRWWQGAAGGLGTARCHQHGAISPVCGPFGSPGVQHPADPSQGSTPSRPCAPRGWAKAGGNRGDPHPVPGTLTLSLGASAGHGDCAAAAGCFILPWGHSPCCGDPPPPTFTLTWPWRPSSCCRDPHPLLGPSSCHGDTCPAAGLLTWLWGPSSC